VKCIIVNSILQRTNALFTIPALVMELLFEFISSRVISCFRFATLVHLRLAEMLNFMKCLVISHSVAISMLLILLLLLVRNVKSFNSGDVIKISKVNKGEYEISVPVINRLINRRIDFYLDYKVDWLYWWVLRWVARWKSCILPVGGQMVEIPLVVVLWKLVK